MRNRIKTMAAVYFHAALDAAGIAAAMAIAYAALWIWFGR